MKHNTILTLCLAGLTLAAAATPVLLARQDSSQPARAPEQPASTGSTGSTAGQDQGQGAGNQNNGQGEELDFGFPRGSLLDLQGLDEVPDEPTGDQATELIAFNNAELTQVILTLQRLSGRPVQPDSLLTANTAKITIINSTPLAREDALNLLVDGLFLNRICVIDRGSYLAVVGQANLQEGMVPVLGPDEDILNRKDTGMVVEKVFQIRNGKAATIREKIQAQGPPNMKIEVEEDTNQIIALYNIGTLQRVQEQINKLDIEGTNLVLETFYLKYGDADTVAQLIVGLFGEQEDQSQRNQQGPFGPRVRNQQATAATTTQHLTVVTDKTQNSVSVRTEPSIIEKIREQVKSSWDVPLSMHAVAPVIRTLKNSDAVKMAELLNTMFGKDEDTVNVVDPGNFFGGFNQQQQRQSTSRTSGTEPPKISRLAGQVSFYADRAKNTLFIQAKSPEYYDDINKIIDDLDVPSDANIPVKYELKHAEADDLANRLNAILAEAGQRVDVERVNTGLNEQAISSIVQGDQGANTGTNNQQQENQPIQFPWMGGSPDENARLASTLIGQIRIMPIPSQNALLVLAPPELKTAMATLIDLLDMPVRQVLIQAIVCEVSIEEETSLGIRWGSGNVADGPNTDNRVVVGSNVTGEKNQLINALFDTSTLGVNMDLNVALQALAAETNVNVLFRPKVVTATNEEAHFFDGQDIPFITNSTTTDVGGVTQSFQYLAVGIQLSVRPHVTEEGNVDLRVNLKLSSVVPGQTLFGGSILDRRETSTKVTVMDGQTVVISGIKRTEVNDIVRKIPLLGDIPFIGGLFRSTEKSHTQTELVAFIRPTVLNTPEKIRAATLGDFRTLNKSREELEKIDTEKYPASPDEYRDPSEDPMLPTDDDAPSTGDGGAIWWEKDNGSSSTGADSSAALPRSNDEPGTANAAQLVHR